MFGLSWFSRASLIELLWRTIAMVGNLVDGQFHFDLPPFSNLPDLLKCFLMTFSRPLTQQTTMESLPTPVTSFMPLSSHPSLLPSFSSLSLVYPPLNDPFNNRSISKLINLDNLSHPTVVRIRWLIPFEPRRFLRRLRPSFPRVMVDGKSLGLISIEQVSWSLSHPFCINLYHVGWSQASYWTGPSIGLMKRRRANNWSRITKRVKQEPKLPLKICFFYLKHLYWFCITYVSRNSHLQLWITIKYIYLSLSSHLSFVILTRSWLLKWPSPRPLVFSPNTQLVCEYVEFIYLLDMSNFEFKKQKWLLPYPLYYTF